MISKMKNYVACGKLKEALIVGKNLFASNMGDVEIFKAYSFILEAAMRAENTSKGKIVYLNQLTSALSDFSKVTNIDDNMIDFIVSQEERLKRIQEDIDQLRKQEEREYIKNKILSNDNILKSLSSEIENLKDVKDKASFDSTIQKIKQYELAIDKAYLSDRQQPIYDLMIQQFSKIEDLKLHSFKQAEEVKYNEQALASYERVYRFFKTGEALDGYKDIIKGLFEYDSDRLFRETLSYYDNVYSFILSKLNDAEKYQLTKAAIYSKLRR